MKKKKEEKKKLICSMFGIDGNGYAFIEISILILILILILIYLSIFHIRPWINPLACFVKTLQEQNPL